MKPAMILLWLMSFASFALAAPKYKHKSEAEIARMTPAQRVDEWCDEEIHHSVDLDDNQSELIEPYILRDGLAALPRIIEITDEYDPTRGSCRRDTALISNRMLLNGRELKCRHLRSRQAICLTKQKEET